LDKDAKTSFVGGFSLAPVNAPFGMAPATVVSAGTSASTLLPAGLKPPSDQGRLPGASASQAAPPGAASAETSVISITAAATASRSSKRRKMAEKSISPSSASSAPSQIVAAQGAGSSSASSSNPFLQQLQPPQSFHCFFTPFSNGGSSTTSGVPLSFAALGGAPSNSLATSPASEAGPAARATSQGQIVVPKYRALSTDAIMMQTSGHGAPATDTGAVGDKRKRGQVPSLMFGSSSRGSDLTSSDSRLSRSPSPDAAFRTGSGAAMRDSRDSLPSLSASPAPSPPSVPHHQRSYASSSSSNSQQLQQPYRPQQRRQQRFDSARHGTRGEDEDEGTVAPSDHLLLSPSGTAKLSASNTGRSALSGGLSLAVFTGYSPSGIVGGAGSSSAKSGGQTSTATASGATLASTTSLASNGIGNLRRLADAALGFNAGSPSTAASAAAAMQPGSSASSLLGVSARSATTTNKRLTSVLSLSASSSGVGNTASPSMLSLVSDMQALRCSSLDVATEGVMALAVPSLVSAPIAAPLPVPPSLGAPYVPRGAQNYLGSVSSHYLSSEPTAPPSPPASLALPASAYRQASSSSGSNAHSLRPPKHPLGAAATASYDSTMTAAGGSSLQAPPTSGRRGKERRSSSFSSTNSSCASEVSVYSGEDGGGNATGPEDEGEEDNSAASAHSSSSSSGSSSARPFRCTFLVTIPAKSSPGQPSQSVKQPCGMAFKCKSRLQDHIRTHSDERPYVCTWAGCGMRFRQGTHLRGHINSVHTKSVTWPCARCGKLWTRKENCRRHEKTCNGVLRERVAGGGGFSSASSSSGSSSAASSPAFPPSFTGLEAASSFASSSSSSSSSSMHLSR
jgi:hypothetical protein